MSNLWDCARNNDVEGIRRLVAQGQDVNAKERYDIAYAYYYAWTPLHVAMHYGRLEAALVLIELGARLDIQDNQGKTPIQVASADFRASFEAAQREKSDRERAEREKADRERAERERAERERAERDRAERERAEKIRQFSAMSWERVAGEFGAVAKAETIVANEGPSRCIAVWRSALENSDAEARRREETARTATAAVAEPRAQIEGQRRRETEAQERIAALERELAQQKKVLEDARSQKTALERQAATLEQQAAAAEQANRSAAEQLAAVRRAHEAAVARLDAFAGLVRRRDMGAFSIADVSELLLELGLGEHRARFEKEGIDGTALGLLDGAAMQELGIESLAERKRLMHAVQLITRIGVVRLTAATILQADKDTTARAELMVATWNTEEVTAWLQERGIPADTCASLARACVNGEVLLNLQQNDLREVCSKMGERVKIASMSEQVRERFYAAVHIFAKHQPSSVASVASAGDPIPAPSPSSSHKPKGEVAAASPAAEEPPEEFLCPITQAVMRDPVLAADGFSYERSAIERWLADHNTSPMTGAPLEDKTLRPEHTLRSATNAWLEKHH